MQTGSIRLVLADDHSIVRAGLRRLLETVKGFEVVAEARNGEELFDAYFAHKPDLAITDLPMPGVGGIDIIVRIRAKDPTARLLVLSAHEDVSFPVRVIKAGGLGYLSKRTTVPETLFHAVHQVAQGHVFLERTIAQRIALASIKGNADEFKALTDRELEVFRLLAEGYTVSEVAQMLFLSPKTVGTYQTRLLQKLGIKSSAMLTRLAIRKGLIEC